MISEQDILEVVLAKEKDAIGYSGQSSPLQENRAKLLNYYNQRLYGDEIEGQSKVVTGEVFETIEGMIPQLRRLLLQNRNIGVFTTDNTDYDEEAEQKTKYANYIFKKKHNAKRIISSMLKDGLLQFTGWIKVTQDQSTKSRSVEFEGQDAVEFEITKAELKEDQKLVDVKRNKKGLYSFRIESIQKCNTQKVENVPADDCLIGKGDRDFEDPDFIGQRTWVRKSKLYAMGFDKKKIAMLTSGSPTSNSIETARSWDLGSSEKSNPTNRESDKGYWLGEYYTKIDTDGDGIEELWQIFKVDNVILSQKRVDEHPYCVFTPIPLPHRAIGSCPAKHVAPYQHWKSSLARQMNNNIYATNFNRALINENVDIEDYMTLRHGSAVRCAGTAPVQNNFMPLPVMNQVPAVLEGISYVDSMTEKVSGVTAHNQGTDSESLNKTATGFMGIKDMSMMRIEVIAQEAADTLEQVFKKITRLSMRYQNEEVQIRVHSEPLRFNPVKEWNDWDAHCDVDVGLGAGERQEKIANYNNVLQLQQHYNDTGNPLSDLAKQYNTLDKLMQVVGIKDTENHFNNPEMPEQILMAELQKAQMQIQEMQQQMNNPLAEAEIAKGQMKMQEQKQKQEHDFNMKMAEMEQKDKYHNDEQVNKDIELGIKLSELEMKSGQNVKGALI